MTERRVTVRGIVFKEGKILAQQLQPYTDGIERDYWCTPDGSLEDSKRSTPLRGKCYKKTPQLFAES